MERKTGLVFQTLEGNGFADDLVLNRFGRLTF